jgi:probable phosphoglycerate mutase
VADIAGLPVVADAGLRERAFGIFEGRTFAQIEADWPDQAQRWRKRDPTFEPEGGESLLRFRERIVGTLQRLAVGHPGEQIVVVGHGGVMDVLYRAATGQELQAPRTWALGNAAINRLLWTPDGMTLVGWADTGHLDDAALDEATA